MMNAVIVQEHGGPEQLVLRESPVPEPGEHEVRLHMHATSVNFADLKGRRAPYRHFQAPYIPGFDGVGTIEALGPGVTEFQIGQRVAAYTKGGSYAEKAIARTVFCYPLPNEVSNEDGTAIGVLITAYNALTWAGRFQAGENVLVHAGAGGVGSCAIQIARLLGASTVFSTVGSEAKREICLQLGAARVFFHHEKFAADINQAVQDSGGTHGVDVILDTLGGPVFEENAHCLATFGRHVIFGHSTGRAGSLESKPLHRENRAIIGYSSGGYRRHRPERLRPTADAVIQLLRDKKIQVLRGATFPLAEAHKAHELYENRQNVGKVILYPEAPSYQSKP